MTSIINPAFIYLGLNPDLLRKFLEYPKYPFTPTLIISPNNAYRF
jgi:hypothetical protein